MSADKETLVGIDEIGEVIADSLVSYFSEPEHRQLVERLKAAGLQMQSQQKEQIQTGTSLSGLNFVISGVFSSMSRDEAKELIESNGGKCSGSVSSKTDYLLAGEGMGPAKLEKATQLGVKIITEEELMNMLGETPAAKISSEPDKPAQTTLF
jgi:DNA ligase (NAD+)